MTPLAACRKGHPMDPDWVEMGAECPKCLNIRKPLPGVPHKREDFQRVLREVPICDKCEQTIESHYLDGTPRCRCPKSSVHPLLKDGRPTGPIVDPGKAPIRLYVPSAERVLCERGHSMNPRWLACPICELAKEQAGEPSEPEPEPF